MMSAVRYLVSKEGVSMNMGGIMILCKRSFAEMISREEGIQSYNIRVAILHGITRPYQVIGSGKF